MSQMTIDIVLFRRLVERLLNLETKLIQLQSIDAHSIDFDLKANETLLKLKELQDQFREAETGQDYAVPITKLGVWLEQHQNPES